MKKIYKYDSKVKCDNKNIHMNKDVLWILQIILMAFILSLALSFISETIIPNVHVLISLFVLIMFIVLGILFDMIGVSVTVADKKIFNSMASKKIKGAKTALELIKNNSKVSSFCNDVIGDICGILSGGAAITVATSLSNVININVIIVNLIMTSFLAAITIGGKAIGKSLAINKANDILFKFAKIIDLVTFSK